MSIITLLVLIFIIGYCCIAIEHSIKIDKTASALLTGMLLWAIVAVFGHSIPLQEAAAIEIVQKEGWKHFIEHELVHHFYDIANILFFLLGAMTIVETVDIHDGFYVITNQITTRNKTLLLWIVSILTFFLSAVLDNLTTSIVMVSLLSKLISDRYLRLLYASMVVIAANAGGAWSPIGDVTTTMLWIGGQITTFNIMKMVFLPSVTCMALPTFLMSFQPLMRGTLDLKNTANAYHTTITERYIVFFVGISALLFVPVFKTITHLPPSMGMMFGLGVLWLTVDIIHRKKPHEDKRKVSIYHALERVDVPSVLFFLGILMAVAALQSVGILKQLAEWLAQQVGNNDIIVVLIGMLSAVLDNVPLVAACMGMYDVVPSSMYFMQDGKFWEFLAYCAGTGGSMLIIGSAAGVAVMGLERINFMWYLRHITWLAAAGYFAGVAVYLLQYMLIH